MPDVYLSRFRLHLVVRRHRLVFLFYYDFIVVRSFFYDHLLVISEFMLNFAVEKKLKL